ncbi:hypothetical protein HZ994_02110 [Akkermansiaceae bacterium]|nr:hypothetical protein HZ994_02110 [Akkermansiaceae bacterium]
MKRPLKQKEGEILHNGLTGEAIPGEERFIKRIPLDLFRRASEKSKAAVVTLGAIFYIAGMAKSNTFRLAPSQMDAAGAVPDVRKRGLRDLEKIGVIRFVEKGRGKAPTIKIVR